VAIPINYGVQGSGTTGTIPIWASGTSIGNSLLSQATTTITLTGGATATNTGFYTLSSINDFLQYDLKNTSTGTSAQSTYSLTADNGSALTGFMSININNSTFTAVNNYSIGVANDCSVLSSGQDLYLANSHISKDVIVSLGKTASPFFDERFRLQNASNVGGALFTLGNSLVVRKASTQDSVALAGRAGGTSSFSNTVTTAALTASRTTTLPDADVTLTAGTSIAGSIANTQVALGSGTNTVAGQNWLRTETTSIPQSLMVGDGTVNCGLLLNGTTGATNKDLTWASNTASATTGFRWTMRVGTAEGGANSGSNWSLIARDDTGTTIDNPVSIVRASGGLATITRPTSITSTTDSTTTTTGSIITAGGLGVAKALFVGTTGSFGGNVTITTAAGTRVRADTTSAGTSNIGYEFLSGGVSQWTNIISGGATGDKSWIIGDQVAGYYALYITRTTQALSSAVFGGTLDATSTSNAALAVSGGLGVAKKIFAGDNITATTSATSDIGLRAINSSTTNAGFLLAQCGNGTTSGKQAYVNFYINETTTQSWVVGAFSSTLLSFRDATNGYNAITITAAPIASSVITFNPTLDASAVGTAANVMAGGLSVAKALFGGAEIRSVNTSITTTAFTGAGTATLGSSPGDGYLSGFASAPTYNGAFTVTRHNYFQINNPLGTSTITDAAVMTFNAAIGTHKAVASGTTKTSPGTVTAWIKVNINGTLHYIPAYASQTS
jgi:hypothetical protein